MSETNFLSLPRDMRRLVLCMLDIPSWRSAAQACAGWRAAANDDFLWTFFYEQSMGEHDPTNAQQNLKGIHNFTRLFNDPINLTYAPFRYSGALTPATTAISLDDCNRSFGIASTHRNQIRIWHSMTLSCELTIDCSAIGKPRRLIAFLHEKEPRLMSLHKADQNQIRVWDLDSGAQIGQLSIDAKICDIGQWTTEGRGHELVVLTTVNVRCFSPVTLEKTSERQNHIMGDYPFKLLTRQTEAWVVYGQMIPPDRNTLQLDANRVFTGKSVATAHWNGSKELITQAWRDTEAGKVRLPGGRLVRFCPNNAGHLAEAVGRFNYLLLRCHGGELLALRNEKEVKLLDPTATLNTGHALVKEHQPTILAPNGPVVFNRHGQPVLLRHWRFAHLSRIGRTIVWGPLTWPLVSLSFLAAYIYYDRWSRLSTCLILAPLTLSFAHQAYTQSFPRTVD